MKVRVENMSMEMKITLTMPSELLELSRLDSQKQYLDYWASYVEELKKEHPTMSVLLEIK